MANPISFGEHIDMGRGKAFSMTTTKYRWNT